MWGKMSFQHCIEHLTETLQMSNGNNPQKMPDVPEHIFDGLKKFLMGKNDFPKGFISPLTGENLPALKHISLNNAIQEFITELEIYKDFWQKNENTTLYSPTFGNLNKDQWDKFHQKHFKHHFTQFGLI